MAESEEIQRHLREIWQKFHMVFQKKENDESEITVNYYCACIKCNKVYQFKDSSDGSWVGLGRVGLKSCIFRRVGLGWVELSDGLGWVGSVKMDPCPPLGCKTFQERKQKFASFLA
ncbi:hypothetical protein HELRODRAFT_168315 [Helobdella robusta]|uniref:Uncharacterized protein n=1 Tax=Helobdella robusta TaxID=6412 RepID=T1F0F4_HELRO|nr:hypothetical protein HELRODRAFT_168315 [Helobdella robusta]ESO09343.1 hypothetical protein HELRODRAFT_168315 [Helobdella robusta]